MMVINPQPSDTFIFDPAKKILILLVLSVISCLSFLGYHHPSVEFECCKPLPVIRHVLVCLCACACVCCALRLSTCLVIGSFRSGSVGGRASLKRCNEINDPCFCRCDQQTTLSSRSKTKELTEGGKVENATRQEPLTVTSQAFRIFFFFFASGVGGQTSKLFALLCTYVTSLSIFLSLFAWNLLPNAVRLSHLCQKWIVS